MTWLALAFWLELGFTPFDQFNMYIPTDSFLVIEQQYYAEFNVEVTAWNSLFVGGDVRIYAWRNEDHFIGFNPNRGAFLIFAGLRLNPFEIGFRHYCTHPIIPFIPREPAGIIWEGSYEEVYIRIGGKTH
jgi:hypothetical protein